MVRIALKRHTAEQIVGMLRQVEVELPGGIRVNEVCRDLGRGSGTFSWAGGDSVVYLNHIFEQIAMRLGTVLDERIGR